MFDADSEVLPHHAEFSSDTHFRAVRPSVQGEAAIQSIPRASVPGLSLDPLLLGMGQEFHDYKASSRSLPNQSEAIAEEDEEDEDEADDEDDAENDADEVGVEDAGDPAASEAEAKLQAKKARKAELATKKLLRQQKRLAQADADLATVAVGFALGTGVAVVNADAHAKEEKKSKLIKESMRISSNKRDISYGDADDDNSRPGSDAEEEAAALPRPRADEPDEDIFSSQTVEETFNKMKIVREQCLACTVPYTDSSKQRAETTMRGLLTPEQEARLQEDEVRVRRFLRWEEDKRENAAHDQAKSGMRKAQKALGRLNMLEAIAHAKETPAASQPAAPTQRSAASQQLRKGMQVVQATTRRRRSSSAKQDNGTSLPALVTK